MSLVSFHRFLIATAIVFCLGFGAWEVRAYVLGGAGPGALALGALFGVLGAGLAVYLVRLRSILKLDE
jgi:hypothetical protein